MSKRNSKQDLEDIEEHSIIGSLDFSKKKLGKTFREISFSDESKKFYEEEKTREDPPVITSSGLDRKRSSLLEWVRMRSQTANPSEVGIKPERREKLKGDEIIDRKRSSTISGASSDNRIAKTYKIKNVSIFKGDGREKSDITVTAQEMGTSERDIVPEEGSLAGFKASNTRNVMLPCEVNHARYNSVATFITSSNANIIKKQKMPLMRKDRLTLESMQIPKRWISLRNVISFFNVLILIIAILAIALISYYTGAESISNAISAMSNVTINEVNLKLDNLFNKAELINIFIQRIFSTNQSQLTTSFVALSHLYYLFQQTNSTFDQIFVASANHYAGIGMVYAPNGNTNWKFYLAKYMNLSTYPYQYVYQINSKCRGSPMCVNSAFYAKSSPLEINLYNSSYIEYYMEATRRLQSGWTNVYRLRNSPNFGLTGYLPNFLDNGRVKFVSGVDITLNSLSLYLSQTSSLITNENVAPVFIFIIDTEGYLIATSQPRKFQVIKNNTRIHATNANSPEIQSSVDHLLKLGKSFSDIPWNEDGTPTVMKDIYAHIIVGNYRHLNINWIIVVYIP
jgi:hypothetical protein